MVKVVNSILGFLTFYGSVRLGYSPSKSLLFDQGFAWPLLVCKSENR